MRRPTGFSPSDFMSSVETMGGISRRNRYTMQITPPTTFSVPAENINFLAVS